MSNWKQTLLKGAQEKGMCGDYLEPLSLCVDKISAIELYKMEPKWALTHDYPTLDELRRDFSMFGIEGLFVDTDFHGEILNEENCYIFHACKGTIRTGLNVDKAIIPDLHFAHGCHVEILSEGVPAQVEIHVYGDDNVIATKGDSIFKIHRHD